MVTIEENILFSAVTNIVWSNIISKVYKHGSEYKKK